MATPKDSAIQLINHVSDNATWSDIMYELYVKQKIETGLKDIEEGRTISHNVSAISIQVVMGNHISRHE